MGQLIHKYLIQGFPLKCSCEGIIKPDVVFFGEQLPREALDRAFQLARQCDLLMVLGSSLSVYPIGYLPQIAHSSGARIMIINLEPTQLDWLAQLVIPGKLSQVLPRILELLEKLN